jgi:hypothetical protein
MALFMALSGSLYRAASDSTPMTELFHLDLLWPNLHSCRVALKSNGRVTAAKRRSREANCRLLRKCEEKTVDSLEREEQLLVGGPQRIGSASRTER